MKISLFLILCFSIGYQRRADNSYRQSSLSALESHTSAKLEAKLLSRPIFFHIFSDNDYVGNPLHICTTDYFQCTSPKQCIPQDKVCNRKVDCVDASDETNCSCPTRLTPNKLCDGYRDCPNGEDELGCFGCNENEFSCFGEPAKVPKCYRVSQKCDRKSNCLNGKDEEDCFLVAKDISSPQGLLIPTDDGILYFQGHIGNEARVYPVCVDELSTAFKVCERLLGQTALE